MTFVQCWINVEDVGPALYKCYTNVFCLLGCHTFMADNITLKSNVMSSTEYPSKNTRHSASNEHLDLIKINTETFSEKNTQTLV